MRKLYKLPKLVLIFTLLLSTVIGNEIPVSAATYQPVNLGTISGTGADVKLGNDSAFWKAGIGKISVNDEIAFCIEPTTLGLTGPYHDDGSDWDASTRRMLALIVYNGWDSTSKTDDDYATTQFMIWEALGATVTKWFGDFGNRYQNLKVNVQMKIDKHNIKPSFNASTDNEVILGETLSLSDSNDVLSDYYVKDNGGATVVLDGNQMKVTPNLETPEDLSILLQKEPTSCEGTSLAFRSSANGGQDVGVFKIADPNRATLKINVLKFGNLNISKQDEDGI